MWGHILSFTLTWLSLDWPGGTLHLSSDTFSLGLGLSQPLSFCLSQSPSLCFSLAPCHSPLVFSYGKPHTFFFLLFAQGPDMARYPTYCSHHVLFSVLRAISLSFSAWFMWQINFPVSAETRCLHGDLHARSRLDDPSPSHREEHTTHTPNPRHKHSTHNLHSRGSLRQNLKYEKNFF